MPAGTQSTKQDHTLFSFSEAAYAKDQGAQCCLQGSQKSSLRKLHEAAKKASKPNRRSGGTTSFPGGNPRQGRPRHSSTLLSCALRSTLGSILGCHKGAQSVPGVWAPFRVASLHCCLPKVLPLFRQCQVMLKANLSLPLWFLWHSCPKHDTILHALKTSLCTASLGPRSVVERGEAGIRKGSLG